MPASLSAAPEPSQDALSARLDALIADSVAAARTVQQQERSVANLERELAGAAGEFAARQRALAASKVREAEVLAALERLARARPETALFGTQAPLDRIRGALLMSAAVPVLSGEARRLSAEIDALGGQHGVLADREHTLTQNRAALSAARTELARIVEQRSYARSRLVREDAEATARTVKIGGEASDVPDLIRRVGAEPERHDREVRPQAPSPGRVKAETADPTRPKTLRSFDLHTMLATPVAGSISRRFGESDAAGNPSQGLDFATAGGAAVVAPFDGRVEFAGPFRGMALILIIGHGDGYHSLLAGLGKIDVRVGEWVVASEPVASAPRPAKTDGDVSVYLELCHDGRPIDPQMSLATH